MDVTSYLINRYRLRIEATFDGIEKETSPVTGADVHWRTYRPDNILQICIGFLVFISRHLCHPSPVSISGSALRSHSFVVKSSSCSATPFSLLSVSSPTSLLEMNTVRFLAWIIHELDVAGLPVIIANEHCLESDGITD